MTSMSGSQGFGRFSEVESPAEVSRCRQLRKRYPNAVESEVNCRLLIKLIGYSIPLALLKPVAPVSNLWTRCRQRPYRIGFDLGRRVDCCSEKTCFEARVLFACWTTPAICRTIPASLSN